MTTRRRITAGLSAGVLALASVWLASCGGGDKGPPRIDNVDRRQWVCESCDHTFLGPNVKGLQTCPQCGKEAAIRSFTYKCLKCNKFFEVYRYFDCADTKAPKGPDGKPVEPGIYFKKKGGEWMQDEEMLGSPRCPHCGNASYDKMAPGIPPAKKEKKGSKG